MRAIAAKATAVGSMNFPPKIQSARAESARRPITISFRDVRPIVESSLPAQAGTSTLFRISGA